MGAVTKRTYVDDVFATYLWAGNSSTRTIATGLDMSGEGGMVAIKSRSHTQDWVIGGTGLGDNHCLAFNTTGGKDNQVQKFKSLKSTGFEIGNDHEVNSSSSSKTYSGFSYRKAPGFFDVVTYTGNPTSGGRQIAHSLGCVPGMIMIKCTSESKDWIVYHRELGNGKALELNTADPEATSSTYWNDTDPTSTHFTLGTSITVNGDSKDYIAYVFAGGASGASEAKSLYWNDSSDKLKCGDASNTTADFNFGTGDLTLECWIKCAASQADYPRLIAIGPQWEAEQAALQWDHDENDNKVAFYCYNHSSSTTSPLLLSSAKDFNGDGQWHHVAVSRKSNVWRLFVDGILEDTETWAGSTNTANSYCTIGHHTASSAHFTGHISNVRIVKGTAVYDSSFRVPTKPLTDVTNTKLLCCNSSSRTGATVTPITLTEVSLADPTSESPFDDPAAFTFGENKDQGIIKCGSYTGNGSSTGPEINLGFEPQWILHKSSSVSGTAWHVFDCVRGVVTGGNDAILVPNTSAAEASDSIIDVTSTGFKITTSAGGLNQNDGNYFYMAIRRSDGYVGKPYEAGEGTSVFAMDTGAGSSTIPNFDSTFPVDFAMARTINGNDWNAGARMLGANYAKPNTSDAWGSAASFLWDSNVGWNTYSGWDSGAQSWMWKRHAGLDVVAAKGTGVARQIPHSLNKPVEMIWAKKRSGSDNWVVGHKGLDGGTAPWTHYLSLNLNIAEGDSDGAWNDTAPTSTHFSVGTWNEVNGSGEDYLYLLFASVDGISKVGSYTGNGSSNGPTINLGFQPRFVLIKCTSNGSTNWKLFDTTRGIDKDLSLNTSDAQADDTDWMDLSSTGFQLVDGDGETNGNSRKYIYYAHA